MLSSLVAVIFVLVIIGLVIYLMENYLPMPQPIKVVIYAIIVLAICWWLLSLIGVAPKLA